MEFGLELYGNIKTIKSLQILQNMFIRLILNLPRTTPIAILHQISNLPYMEQRHMRYTAKHYIRTHTATPNHPLKLYKNEFYKYKKDILNNDFLNQHQAKHNSKTYNFNKFHPLNLGYKALVTMKHPIINSALKIPTNLQPFSALPIYKIKLPYPNSPIKRIHKRY